MRQTLHWKVLVGSGHVCKISRVTVQQLDTHV